MGKIIIMKINQLTNQPIKNETNFLNMLFEYTEKICFHNMHYNMLRAKEMRKEKLFLKNKIINYRINSIKNRIKIRT